MSIASSAGSIGGVGGEGRLLLTSLRGKTHVFEAVWQSEGSYVAFGGVEEEVCAAKTGESGRAGGL